MGYGSIVDGDYAFGAAPTPRLVLFVTKVLHFSCLNVLLAGFLFLFHGGILGNAAYGSIPLSAVVSVISS